MNKRALSLFGVLAFTSAGVLSASLVARSAYAQGGTGTTPPPPPSTTGTDTTPPPPPTTPAATETTPPPPVPTAQASATTEPTPPPPPTTQTGTDKDAPPPTAVESGGSDEIPSIFTSSYTPEKDKASDKKPTAKLRWAGTSYFQQFGVSPEIVAPGLVQTYAPIADTFLAFQPRFSLTKNWQLRGRITASYEFTDNANSSTTRSRQLVFGDFLPEIDYKGIPSFAGIKTIVAAGSGLPTSAASQARTLITSPFAKFTLDKSFEKVLGGELEFIVGAVYSHPIYSHTTAQLADQPQYQAACFGGGSDVSCGNQASGAANVENSLTASFIVTAKWGKWSPTLLFYLFNQWAYQLPTLPGVQPEPNGSTNFRQSSYFNASLDYEVNGWLTGEIGYQMYRTILTGESTIGNPFFDAYQDMRVYLGVNIALDSLYEAIQGKKDEEGILRTKNERRSSTTF